jgi:hypothetical protein
LLTLLVFALLATATRGQSTRPAVRFEAVDVMIDPRGRAMAAYQVEITLGDAKLVGIEGGEHPAFAEPPRYDPKALQRSRVILAALSTASDLPRSPTRVARLHVMTAGDAAPNYTIRLIVAGDASAKAIDAEATLRPTAEAK